MRCLARCLSLAAAFRTGGFEPAGLRHSDVAWPKRWTSRSVSDVSAAKALYWLADALRLAVAAGRALDNVRGAVTLCSASNSAMFGGAKARHLATPGAIAVPPVPFAQVESGMRWTMVRRRRRRRRFRYRGIERRMAPDGAADGGCAQRRQLAHARRQRDARKASWRRGGAWRLGPILHCSCSSLRFLGPAMPHSAPPAPPAVPKLTTDGLFCSAFSHMPLSQRWFGGWLAFGHGGIWFFCWMAKQRLA